MTAEYLPRCRHCHGLETEHVDTKCLFDTSNFDPMSVEEHLNFPCYCHLTSGVAAMALKARPTVTGKVYMTYAQWLSFNEGQ